MLSTLVVAKLPFCYFSSDRSLPCLNSYRAVRGGSQKPSLLSLRDSEEWHRAGGFWVQYSRTAETASFQLVQNSAYWLQHTRVHGVPAASVARSRWRRTPCRVSPAESGHIHACIYSPPARQARRSSSDRTLQGRF